MKVGWNFRGRQNRMRQRMFYPLVYFRRLCLIWLDGLKKISEVQHRIETQFEGYTFLSGMMSLPSDLNTEWLLTNTDFVYQQTCGCPLNTGTSLVSMVILKVADLLMSQIVPIMMWFVKMSHSYALMSMCPSYSWEAKFRHQFSKWIPISCLLMSKT